MNRTTSAPLTLTLLTAVTALVLTACTDNGGARLAAPEDFTATKSSTSQNVVPLGITVGGTPNRIVDDGLGEYVNGVASVAAYIDGTGTLFFNTGARTLGFDFSAQTTGAAYSPNLTGMGKAQVLTQTNGLLQPEPMLTALPVGGAACYPLSIGFSTPSTSFWVLFHSTTENTASSSSTYAFITRTGSTKWSADVGSASCAGNANWAGLWTLDLTARKATRILRGTYAMPFTMQLRAL